MSVHRIAVVGGGIFGVTAAVQLGRLGHRVVLFEQANELLSAASRANQRRLHRGYHYPRGLETATAVLGSVKSFRDEYRSAMCSGYAHYVAIARQDSLVTADQYLAFCDTAGLRYREEYPPFLRRSSVDVSLRVEESLIDIDELRRVCAAHLRAAGVQVRLRARAGPRELQDFDRVVLATYSSLNELHTEAAGRRPYQFEVCEKPLVHLPAMYRGSSLVVMDGPFMCLDPVVGSETFLLGNVDHGIHSTTIGPYPLVPRALAGYINSGLVTSPPVTRIGEFTASARRFLMDFDQLRHVGSYFTVRAVLPDLEATDDRPSLVRRVDERTFVLFGGKITTCVDAAHELVTLLTSSPRESSVLKGPLHARIADDSAAVPLR